MNGTTFDMDEETGDKQLKAIIRGMSADILALMIDAHIDMGIDVDFLIIAFDEFHKAGYEVENLDRRWLFDCLLGMWRAEIGNTTNQADNESDDDIDEDCT